MVPTTRYGHLDFILVITLAQKMPPCQQEAELDAEEDKDQNKDNEEKELTTHVLAHITKAKGIEGNAATELLTYQELGHSFILNIKTLNMLWEGSLHDQ